MKKMKSKTKMNKFLLLLFAIILISACENKQTNKSDSDVTNSKKVIDIENDINSPEMEEIPMLRKCYTYSSGDNIGSLSLELTDENKVTGSLKLMGDENKNGSVIGEFSNDTLFVTYKYTSGNEQAAKELVFLEDDENFTLQMANANYTKNKGVEVIEDYNTIKFDGKLFEKLDCDQE